MEAVAIERHITINKNLPGPDHQVSLDPKECQDFVRRARRPRSVTELKKEYGEKTIESILGSAEKKPVPEESEVMTVVRKSASSGTKGIPAGTKLTKKLLPEWIYLMRPQDGEIKANEYYSLIGKTVKTNISPFTPLERAMLR